MSSRDIQLITNNVPNLIQRCLADHAVTAWQVIDETTEGTYAIVIGYSDGFEDDEKDLYGGDGERLCMKVGFLKKNSIMSEYGVDWEMPLVPGTQSGEVYDTEMSISEGTDLFKTVEWLLKEYDKYCELKEAQGTEA